jgi:predicted esterase
MFTLIASANEAETDWFCDSTISESQIQWIETALGQQKSVVVRSSSLRAEPILIIFLHADSPFGDPVYQYDLVREITETAENTIAVSILRPGYRDSCGDKSEGNVGHKMGDNYTTEVVESLATMISRIQNQTSPSKTIVMGHSGGAALAALLASRYSDLQDQSILVSCPCILPSWRASMSKLMDNPSWLEPMPGISPIEDVAKLDPSRAVHLWVGDEDKITPPFLSVEYSERARTMGKDVSHTVVSGGDHDMILQDEVLDLVLQSIGK